MKTVLVSGAAGFIGKALCKAFFMKYRVIALERQPFFDTQKDYISVKADIEDEKTIKDICATYKPDVVIHCAGIARQSLRTKKGLELFERINSRATEKLTSTAILFNPDLYFIFLSSVAVYGENRNSNVICETDNCFPTSHYAESKLSAERRLIGLYNKNILKKLDILRLAPVYDNEWSFNLEKRVAAPKKIFYLRFGSGNQKVSVLSRENLVAFIDFRLKHEMIGQFLNIINVCDERPYSFNEIIEVFQRTKYQPQRKVIKIPLYMVGFPIQFIGLLLRNDSTWIHSFYNKLAKELVFDNKKMFYTGFKPVSNLKSVYLDNGV